MESIIECNVVKKKEDLRILVSMQDSLPPFLYNFVKSLRVFGEGIRLVSKNLTLSESGCITCTTKIEWFFKESRYFPRRGFFEEGDVGYNG